MQTCREGERVEFAEAKERLKSSWAVDRDDFARVKEQLKKKNAEHHVQNGRFEPVPQGKKPMLQFSMCLDHAHYMVYVSPRLLS